MGFPELHRMPPRLPLEAMPIREGLSGADARRGLPCHQSLGSPLRCRAQGPHEEQCFLSLPPFPGLTGLPTA